MPDSLASEDRLLSAFVFGGRHPRLKDTPFVAYRRDGADLHGIYRLGPMARRLRPPQGRRPGIFWVNLADKYLGWRLSRVAEARRQKIIVVQGRACPASVEEALRWRALEHEAFALQQRLRETGHRQPASLDGVFRFPRAEVTAAVLGHPELLVRQPTGLRRFKADRGGTLVQLETWVTPQGVDLAAAATALAQGQGLRWGAAFELVVGARDCG